MKHAKKVTAMVLTGALCFSSLGLGAFAADNGAIKENTSRFELSVKRNIWGQGQAYEGHEGKVTIQNKDVVALSDWVLEFDYNGEIKSVSNGILVSHVGNHYVVKAPHWYKVIRPGASVTFEFQGKGTLNDVDINNIYLNSVERPVKETHLKSWALKQSFAKGDLVTYNGLTYKCIQGHRADAFNWTPNQTPALWVKVKGGQASSYDILIQKY